MERVQFGRQTRVYGLLDEDLEEGGNAAVDEKAGDVRVVESDMSGLGSRLAASPEARVGNDGCEGKGAREVELD